MKKMNGSKRRYMNVGEEYRTVIFKIFRTAFMKYHTMNVCVK